LKELKSKSENAGEARKLIQKQDAGASVGVVVPVPAPGGALLLLSGRCNASLVLCQTRVQGFSRGVIIKVTTLKIDQMSIRAWFLYT